MANEWLTKLGGRTSLFLKKNGSLLLTIGTSAGVVLTGVSSAICALKARQKLLAAENEKNDALTTKETLITAAPYYILPVAITGGTIVGICCNHKMNQKEKLALISACGMLATKLEEFKAKVDEIYGENASKMVSDTIDVDKAAQIAPLFKNPDTKLFYEPISGRLIERTENEVLLAEYHFNRNFILRGYANLNEFYDFIGLEHTPEGDVLGWSLDAGAEFYGYSWVDFDHEEHTTMDGLEITDIVMPFSPTADYLLDWEGEPITEPIHYPNSQNLQTV